MDTKNEVATCKFIKKPCPLRWESLNETDDENIRFCDQCEKNVHFCVSDEEAISHAKQNHCIAMPIIQYSGTHNIKIGEPDADWEDDYEPPSKEYEESSEARHIQASKIHSLKDIKYANRYCSQCNYPIADFRKYCWVCGAKE